MNNKKKRRIGAAILYYEERLCDEIASFRECAQKYDAESIVAYLPTMIYNIEETQRKLNKLKSKEKLLSFLADYDDQSFQTN